MPSNKHNNAALLALLASSSIATADGGGSGEKDVEAVAAAFLAELASADETLGDECAPSALKERKLGFGILPPSRDKKKNAADVGVLSSGVNAVCPGPNEVCMMDRTSSLGGRCVSHSRRMQFYESYEEKLQACTQKCPNSKICSCIYGNEDCSVDEVASACRNKEFNCLQPENATFAKVLYCPTYECAVSGTSNSGDDTTEEGGLGMGMSMNAGESSEQDDNPVNDDEDESERGDRFYLCAMCVGYKSFCEFCGTSGSSYVCVDNDFATLCAAAKRDQSYHYNSTCTAFASQFSSAGKTSLEAAATLALVSLSILNRD